MVLSERPHSLSSGTSVMDSAEPSTSASISITLGEIAMLSSRRQTSCSSSRRPVCSWFAVVMADSVGKARRQDLVPIGKYFVTLGEEQELRGDWTSSWGLKETREERAHLSVDWQQECVMEAVAGG